MNHLILIYGPYPHGVQAHYDLVHNRIIAPAGFLNPPFFDPMVDDAWNYGSF